jgi:hypothetical protein
MVVERERNQKRYRVDRRDLAIGERYEMGTTKNPREARRIAKRNLQRHPTHYDVMPAARREMTLREKEANIKPLPKKKKPRPQQQSSVPNNWNGTPW